MIRLIFISLAIYYLLGACGLPQGDFSIMADLPAMYQHCQATEDRDMTPLDFITDHLLNVDGLFDEHNHGDQQKPHLPLSTSHSSTPPLLMVPCWQVSIFKPPIPTQPEPFYQQPFYYSHYISRIFHPPIHSVNAFIFAPAVKAGNELLYS